MANQFREHFSNQYLWWWWKEVKQKQKRNLSRLCVCIGCLTAKRYRCGLIAHQILCVWNRIAFFLIRSFFLFCSTNFIAQCLFNWRTALISSKVDKWEFIGSDGVSLSLCISSSERLWCVFFCLWLVENHVRRVLTARDQYEWNENRFSRDNEMLKPQEKGQ